MRLEIRTGVWRVFWWGVLLVVFIGLHLAAQQSADGKELGVIGATYPIKERSGTDVLRERAAEVDWTTMFNEAGQRALKQRPTDQMDLPRVKTASKRIVDMSYTLEYDVPDFRDPSKIQYPRGYRFNPLDYMPQLNQTFVFINAGDKRQMQWFMKSSYAQDDAVNLLITGGDLATTMKVAKVKVFYAGGLLLNRFGIRAVPSVAKQVGANIEVEEVEVPDVDKNRR